MKLFDIGIGFNEESKTYGALVSASDGKHATLEHAELRHVLWRLRELVLEKTAEIQNLPAEPEPEPNRIISLSESRPPLVAANGEVLNGQH